MQVIVKALVEKGAAIDFKERKKTNGAACCRSVRQTGLSKETELRRFTPVPPVHRGISAPDNAGTRFPESKRYGPTACDYQDRTPLHEAAYYGHLNLVEYFVEKGAPINVIDKFGQTPLFRAVDGGRHDVVKYLVEKKAETNWLDNEQCSVQHCAAFQGFPSMSTWLVYKGAWRNRFAIEGMEEARVCGGGARFDSGVAENGDGLSVGCSPLPSRSSI
ncbi:Serine/threonine-protein phosphatase 6 regulatory ankyrin repeat subunit C (PP6-ARS-C) (Serine/threonine-protein phosphatase 6 regulatory subunit ARS-C) [Durusdinium trenchii]|uniref:Serine/threonine-protein phosphatase 6 regulatory ankyrin repeat subunit C (PP6-ARS-C) (Serine/threonine-protein phosphatase 6 regulatory subunit ARS-C) n=1 Tax=Durusdinium trenchii TaxID=1381693 RepID=A0ABP0PPS3_9DINO